MNEFAGSITFGGKLDKIELPFENFPFITKDGNTTIYCIGKTDIPDSKTLVEDISKKVGAIMIAMDISIVTEDRIWLSGRKIPDLKEMTVGYVLKCIHGSDFEGVSKECMDGNDENVLCVREAENSRIHGGRVIKVDMIS